MNEARRDARRRGETRRGETATARGAIARREDDGEGDGDGDGEGDRHTKKNKWCGVVRGSKRSRDNAPEILRGGLRLGLLVRVLTQRISDLQSERQRPSRRCLARHKREVNEY